MSFTVVDDNSLLLNYVQNSWEPVHREHSFNGTVHVPRPGQLAQAEFSFTGSSLEVHLSFPVLKNGTFAVQFFIDDNPTQINGTFSETGTPPTFVFIPHGLEIGQHDLVISTSSEDLGLDYLLYIPFEGRQSPRVAVIVGGVMTVAVFICTVTFLTILFLRRKRNIRRGATDALNQGSSFPPTPRVRNRFTDFLRRCLEHHPIQPKVEQYVTPVYVQPQQVYNRTDRSVSSQPMSVDPPSSPPPAPPETRQTRRVFMVMNPSDEAGHR